MIQSTLKSSSKPVRRVFGLALSAALVSLFAAACTDTTDTAASAADSELAAYQAEEVAVDEHLAKFDTLDFDVFSNQKWDRLGESHSKDVVVHWPDGRVTTGIDAHIADLKGLFVAAPDTRIKVHPVKIGQGEYTSVTGIFEGTFTEPMPMADGTSIPPTGKSFKLLMNTVSHWKADGTMDEEWLFWDNLTYMKQLGLM
ncbi:MAG: ester cyclase [Polyangiaceae bacterium]